MVRAESGVRLADNRWLLIALQLPAQPSNARVKTWRRLQELGAVAVKNAVYVLPNSAQALEDFAWLRAEIQSVGGQATIFTAASLDAEDEARIADQFQAARTADFKALLAEVRRIKHQSRQTGPTPLDKELRALRQRFEHLKGINFFAAPGATDVEAALAAVERTARPQSPAPTPRAGNPLDPRLYTGRTWVTRPRPGVDRFASAWLIQRFIDPKARFAFAAGPEHVADRVPFDMFDVGFTHEGDRCTFEVLQHRFGLDDPGLRRIAEIVHDVDLKDDRYRAPQAPTIGVLVDGLRASVADDDELLRQGIALFDALYRGLGPSARSPRPSRKRTR